MTVLGFNRHVIIGSPGRPIQGKVLFHQYRPETDRQDGGQIPDGMIGKAHQDTEGILQRADDIDVRVLPRRRVPAEAM
jgi:hypothetical protein